MHENVKVRHGQVGGYLEGSKHAESVVSSPNPVRGEN